MTAEALTRMRQRFPTGADIQRWFCATNWSTFAGELARYAAMESPRLAGLDSLYHMNGLAFSVVRQNISAVAQMSSSRYTPQPGTFDIPAKLFTGKYGSTCTLYMLMAYFAHYLTDYKTTLGTFDIADILKGYRRFSADWNDALAKAYAMQERAMPDDGVERGEGARDKYVLSECRRVGVDEFIRNSGLIERGNITKEEVYELVRLGGRPL